MNAPSIPDATLQEIESRGARGRDVLLLRQWLGLNIVDCCYLLGITTPKWYQYQRHPDQLIDDVSVSLLVWSLLRFPEAHFLPLFPQPAEVYPLYRETAAHSGQRLPTPGTAFALLLGRERSATRRWLTVTEQPPRVSPTVRRLLFALRRVIHGRGVPGFDAWIARARFEAESRGLDFDSMSSWIPDDPAMRKNWGIRRRGRQPGDKAAAEDGN
ncbi:MAG: hypothetical protein H6974_14170 [Gammaproteobacteria bacterium]|nr:hypothetical protein [Gammaproteobacteria bacterium]